MGGKADTDDYPCVCAQRGPSPYRVRMCMPTAFVWHAQFELLRQVQSLGYMGGEGVEGGQVRGCGAPGNERVQTCCVAIACACCERGDTNYRSTVPAQITNMHLGR